MDIQDLSGSRIYTKNVIWQDAEHTGLKPVALLDASA
jgi:hypothetical protein